jgi:DNA-binding NarL/FixJ family response regulator
MTRVFLADDHSIIRDGLKQIMAETEDLRVVGEAANGNELLSRLQNLECDILVLDISMPGKSGLELLKLVHRDCPRLPILILSMHHEDQYALRAFRAGAAGYLTKESDAELLVAAIRKVAAGGIQISPHVAELMRDGSAWIARRSPTPCSRIANTRCSKCWSPARGLPKSASRFHSASRPSARTRPAFCRRWS